MNEKARLESRIKEALQYDEGSFEIDYGPLTKAKERLNEEKTEGRIDMGNFFRRGRMKVSFVFIMVFMLLGGALAVGAETFMRTDSTDYPFVDDPQVLGRWQSVDFVSYANEFVPGEQQFKGGDLYLREYAFAPGGRMLMAVNIGNKALADISSTWTQGLILNSNEKTASKYEITEIDGSTYMFVEWKSGDYTIRGMEPKFYVLKKVDSNDYGNYQCEKRIDRTDYPFVDDSQVVGDWETVDFVRTMDMFDPGKKNWIGGEFMTGMDFGPGGKITFHIKDGRSSSPKNVTWTKGLVLHRGDQTASAYVIKEINGSTYLFFEWKSGDYTMRGMDPQYYVLKKK